MCYTSSMNLFNDFITESLFMLAPAMRNLLIFLFSYGEGLPVIGSILPGGTIAILVGTLSREGYILPWTAIHLIAIGSFLGDMTGFVFGKYLRRFKKIRKIIEAEKNQKKWDLFDKHAALIIIFGKLLPFVRSTPSIFAGARKMSVWRYIFYVAFGSYVWSFAGVFGGSILGDLLGPGAIPLILGSLIVVGIFTFLGNKIHKKNKYKKQNQEKLS